MDQINIFDIIMPNYTITKPIRLIECFAGIGAQVKALKRLQQKYNFKLENYKVVEFDKYAIASYNAINKTNFKTLDITKITATDLAIKDTDKYEYILTYSFPCQDLSLAGKQRGMQKNSGTRSGLLWEIERILNDCDELPQLMLMENVPEVVGRKNIIDFQKWELKLEKLGYSNYIKILNAKDYGIPQNRRRCFMISILGNYNYNFPRHIRLKLKLKDLLEDEVDEKYFLSNKLIKCFTNYKTEKFDRSKQFKPFKNTNQIARTITTRAGYRASDNYIYVPKKTKKGYSIAKIGDGVYINRPHQKRGVVQHEKMPTLKCNPSDVGVVANDLRIRRLTPLECWRLMGFDDEDFYKAEKVNSNVQLYKQAGNSIVVNVLEYIFEEFFKRRKNE